MKLIKRWKKSLEEFQIGIYIYPTGKAKLSNEEIFNQLSKLCRTLGILKDAYNERDLLPTDYYKTLREYKTLRPHDKGEATPEKVFEIFRHALNEDDRSFADGGDYYWKWETTEDGRRSFGYVLNKEMAERNFGRAISQALNGN